MRLEKRLSLAARELARALSILRRTPEKYELAIMIAEARFSCVTLQRRVWIRALRAGACLSQDQRRSLALDLRIPLTRSAREYEIDLIRLRTIRIFEERQSARKVAREILQRQSKARRAAQGSSDQQ